MRILLAVDGSRCSEQATIALVSEHQSPNTVVHVLHVLDWAKCMPLSYSFGEGAAFAEDLRRFLEEKRQEAQRMVNDIADALRHAGFQAIGRIREGDAALEILAYADEFQPDLIVLGSHGRHGLDRLISGSVSELVARRASCSVEIVRSQEAVGQAMA